ncbi:HEPN domain-containing protein [Parabacteroides sp. APC149_11_2_Y6]
MPNIRKKAIEYLDAAQDLINKGHYNSSVHCSYYSRLLHMKYILAHHAERPISYDVQNEKRETGSHDFILEEINNRIDSHKKAKDIVEFFRYLKSERVDADYRDKLFDAEACLDIKQKAEGLKTKLNDQFGTL